MPPRTVKQPISSSPNAASATKLRQQNPGKEFFLYYPHAHLRGHEVHHTGKDRPRSETGEGEVTLEDAQRSRANAPLEQMLALAK